MCFKILNKLKEIFYLATIRSSICNLWILEILRNYMFINNWNENFDIISETTYIANLVNVHICLILFLVYNSSFSHNV